MRFAHAALLALVLAGCAADDDDDDDDARTAAAATSADPEYLTPYGPPAYPFSPAVRVGNLLMLSGQIGTGADGQLVAGGIGPETRQALENIKDVLQRTGSSMDRVVKCTAMLADMKDWPAMNTVYAEYFPEHRPARSAFGATGLALGARIELECWAMTGTGGAAPAPAAGDSAGAPPA